MDTPRIFTSRGLVDLGKLSNDIDQWFANLNPGPDVLLFVTKAIQDRFKDEDFELFQSLKHIFEKDIRQHLIVVFTGGRPRNGRRSAQKGTAVSEPSPGGSGEQVRCV